MRVRSGQHPVGVGAKARSDTAQPRVLDARRGLRESSGVPLDPASCGLQRPRSYRSEGRLDLTNLNSGSDAATTARLVIAWLRAVIVNNARRLCCRTHVRALLLANRNAQLAKPCDVLRRNRFDQSPCISRR